MENSVQNETNQTINPSNQIKELDDIDRALIEKRKIYSSRAMVSFFIGFPLTFIFLIISFTIFIPMILFFLTFFLFGMNIIKCSTCITKFSQRNNEATCKHYEMIHGSGCSGSTLSSRLSGTYSSSRNWNNDPCDLTSPSNWRHTTNISNMRL